MAGQTIRSKAQELKGAAKEKLGEATNSGPLQAEGAAEKEDAQVKQLREDIDAEVEEINRP